MGHMDPDLEPDSPEAKTRSRLVKMWANFAKTGYVPFVSLGLQPQSSKQWRSLNKSGWNFNNSTRKLPAPTSILKPGSNSDYLPVKSKLVEFVCDLNFCPISFVFQKTVELKNCQNRRPGLLNLNYTVFGVHFVKQLLGIRHISERHQCLLGTLTFGQSVLPVPFRYAIYFPLR
jgi:hypothetical protein